MELQKKEIDGELEKIELECQELKNRTTNAELVRDGLAFFDQAWQIATPKQKKDLLHLYIHRIIWTPEKIKMGLYTRPISELCIKSTTVNHDGLIAVDCIDWLPDSDQCENFFSEFEYPYKRRNNKKLEPTIILQ